MKNVLIVILTVICAVLAYLHFGIPKEEPQTCPTCPPPTVVEEQVIEKISPAEVIKLSEVHGISLSTPVDDVDTLIETAGFVCNKSDSKYTSSDPSARAISWQCKHNDLGSSALNISAKNGKIQKIMRSGEASLKDMELTQIHLDDLKARLNSKTGFYTSQTDKNLTFQINHTKENKAISHVKYYMQYVIDTEAQDKVKRDGTYTASIAR